MNHNNTQFQSVSEVIEYLKHILKPELPLIKADEWSVLITLFSTKNKFEDGKLSELSERQRKIIKYLKENTKMARKTVRKWKYRDAIEDKSSCPNHINITLTKEQEDLILFERKHNKRTIDEIYFVLKDKIPDLYSMKIYRCLKRYNLNVLPVELATAERKIKKFKDYGIGYLHIDVLYAPKINKERRYVFTCIDRVSKVAYVEVRRNKTKNDGKEFLQNAIGFYPYKINYILTDNGLEFCFNALPKKRKTDRVHPFVELCKINKIRHRTIKFKHPWTNGMIERFNGKIKSKVFHRYLFENVEDLNTKIIDYVNDYNFNIPLKGLKFKTPAEYLKENFGFQLNKIKISNI